jgi:hypothetical protein
MRKTKKIAELKEEQLVKEKSIHTHKPQIDKKSEKLFTLKHNESQSVFARLSNSPFNRETTERRTETSLMKQSLSQLNARFGEGSTHNLLTQSDQTATMENPKLKMTKSF